MLIIVTTNILICGQWWTECVTVALASLIYSAASLLCLMSGPSLNGPGAEISK